MEPTKAQVEEFWEGYGFEWIKGTKGTWWFEKYAETNYWWEAPDGRKYKDPPPIDLNNLFKYAVVKICVWEVDDNMLTIKGQGKPLEADDEKLDTAWWEVTIDGCQKGKVVVNDVDPALALFWALDEVKEEKDETTKP